MFAVRPVSSARQCAPESRQVKRSKMPKNRFAILGKPFPRSAQLRFPNRLTVLADVHRLRSADVSQFLSVLMLATALTLTVCLGVAAWRQSADKDVDITATIAHQETGWRARPSN